MQEIEVQVDQQFSVPQGIVLIAKYRGAACQFSMLMKNGCDILHERIKNEPVLTYAIFYKIVDSIIPKQGNLAHFTVTDLAEYYATSLSSIYHAIRALRKHDILRRVKKDYYYIHPEIAWNGNTWERIKALAEWKSHCNSNGGVDNSKNGA